MSRHPIKGDTPSESIRGECPLPVGGCLCEAEWLRHHAMSVPSHEPLSIVHSIVDDDAIYTVSMVMFAFLPLLSMRSRRSGRLQSDHIEPARLLAAVAFVLLLWLQSRKGYRIGIVMVSANLVLRLAELMLFDRLHAAFWAWTSQSRPAWRHSRLESAVLFCVFGMSGSSSMAIASWLSRPLIADRSHTEAALTTLFAATTIYPLVLLTLGTLAGRRQYFWHFTHRICGTRHGQKREDSAA